MKPLFVISCPYDTFSGYGARSRDLVKAIIELDKYDVKVMSQRWGNTPFGFCKSHPEWEYLLTYETGKTVPRKPDVWMQITVPNEFQPLGKYNIGVTAGIETTLVDGNWIEGMNKMDLNLVSSEHSKQSFLNTTYQKQNQQGIALGEVKINKPIKVLFEGVNTDVYKVLDNIPQNELCDSLNQIPESFAYLFVGHWLPGNLGEDRKNVGLLVKLFYETFKNKKTKPALILKTAGGSPSYMDREQLLDKLMDIKYSVNSKDLPNVYLLHGDFNDDEINMLYNHPKVKAMVSLTKGEGFGRPLLEFSLSKKPILTTNWSGHIDFLNKEFTTLMNGTLTNVHKSASAKNMLLTESQWFSVNTAEVSHYLKDMFENYKKYVDGGKRQAYLSKTQFNWESMKNQLDTLLEVIPTEVELNIPSFDLSL